MTMRSARLELGSIVTLADFEVPARDRMEPAAFDYVAGGGWDEVTLGEATAAWSRYRFLPRVLRDVRRVDVTSSFLGRSAALPVAVAPMAAQALAHPEAEAPMARAAAAAGIPFCMSTSSSLTLEEVAQAVGGGPDATRWFQLYLVGSMDRSRALVDRAAANGYSALIVTVDLPVPGLRVRDRRSGFALPFLPHLATARDRDQRYAGLEEQRALGLTWADLATIASWSDLPLVVKGILAPDDARRAVDAGVAGIVVSTHGGRQLDRVLATAAALSPIVDVVRGATEVWVDGGVRSGLDVATALALGADGVLLGRPLYWALAAAGEEGVAHALAIVRDELEIALTLLGCASLSELSRELLVEAG